MKRTEGLNFKHLALCQGVRNAVQYPLLIAKHSTLRFIHAWCASTLTYPQKCLTRCSLKMAHSKTLPKVVS